jgi:hypothetical protein
MSNFESEEKVCKNCGHKLQSHLKKRGKCEGDASVDNQWCIANCDRFWE